MKAFTTTTGLVAPLDRVNVDTDQIIPKQYLKSIEKTGFGDNLFDGWRYLDEGDIGMTPNERRINHAFVLNQPRYQNPAILLARRNFGCGSSREHAVWALMEYGFRAVVAPSFADIFNNNCLKNGLLPVVLSEEIVEELFRLALSDGGLELTVDLGAERVALPDGRHFAFSIDPQARRKLIDGVDEIASTLAHAGDIRAFETGYFRRRPWLARGNAGGTMESPS